MSKTIRVFDVAASCWPCSASCAGLRRISPCEPKTGAAALSKARVKGLVGLGVRSHLGRPTGETRASALGTTNHSKPVNGFTTRAVCDV